MNHDLELKLQAWIDGEVSPSQARRLAQLVQENAEARQLVLELRSLRQAITANQPAVVVPEAREFYWSKIQRQIQRQTLHPPAAGWRGLFRWPGLSASLAGLAAMAAVFVFALKQFAPPATFDEVSATADGMEALTFHDQTAGMTVVWLQDSRDSQPTQLGDAADDDADDSDLPM